MKGRGKVGWRGRETNNGMGEWMGRQSGIVNKEMYQGCGQLVAFIFCAPDGATL